MKPSGASDKQRSKNLMTTPHGSPDHPTTPRVITAHPRPNGGRGAGRDGGALASVRCVTSSGTRRLPRPTWSAIPPLTSARNGSGDLQPAFEGSRSCSRDPLASAVPPVVCGWLSGNHQGRRRISPTVPAASLQRACDHDTYIASMNETRSFTSQQLLFKELFVGTLIYAVVLGFFDDHTSIVEARALQPSPGCDRPRGADVRGIRCEGRDRRSPSTQ